MIQLKISKQLEYNYSNVFRISFFNEDKLLVEFYSEINLISTWLEDNNIKLREEFKYIDNFKSIAEAAYHSYNINIEDEDEEFEHFKYLYSYGKIHNLSMAFSSLKIEVEDIYIGCNKGIGEISYYKNKDIFWVFHFDMDNFIKNTFLTLSQFAAT